MAAVSGENKTEAPDPLREAGHCTVPEVVPRVFPPGTDPARVEAILVFGDKWVNGTELRYHFLSDVDAWVGTEQDKDVVRAAFDRWKGIGIGLSFIEVDDASEAEVRIGFHQGEGSWSYVGRQVLDRPMTERTMNFGWRLAGWDYGFDTALHEIGHTLGLPHEHQNPNAGIEWDEDEVYSYFGGPPNNWDRQKTFHNILRKLSPNVVRGSEWDRNSVMHYRFGAGLILKPTEYRSSPLIPAGNLSEEDLEWILHFYPALAPVLPRLEPFESQRLQLSPGQQVDFAVRPEATREYTFQTFGRADTVLALFEDVDGSPRFRAGDDDSGTDLNATFEVKLFKGREYVLRLRLYWAWASGEVAVLMT
jgi:Astacin (Peptidase family M12A)